VWTEVEGETLRLEARVFSEDGGDPATGAIAGPVRDGLALAARLHTAIREQQTKHAAQP
jgi:hypothetical protein